MKKTSILILIALLAFTTKAWAQFGGGSGTAADPYIIHSLTHWNELVTYVAEGNNTEGVYFKQDVQLYPNTMVGTSEHPFKGFYYSDSDSHDMQYTITTDEQYAAPFHYVDGATISNLRVNNSQLTTSAKFAGGIIGHSKGEVHLNGCTMVGGDLPSKIISTVEGDGSHGGFVGYQESGDLIITNCLFAGKLIGSSTTHCGGFVGWSESNNEATVRLLYCLFTPSEVTMTGEYVFVRARNMDYVTLRNCYYSYAFGILQGELSNYANMGQGWTMSYPPTQPFNDPSIFATAIIKGLSSRYPYNLGNPISIDFTVLRADGIELTQGTHYSVLIKDSNDNAVTNVTDCGNYTLHLTGLDPYYTNTLTMPFSVLQLGTEDNPYLIYTADDWNAFAENVNNGNTYSGKFFRLMEDISVTTMVGASTTGDNFKYFNGTFDGNGHTLNVAYSSGSSDWRAPFSSIDNATIKNLHVTGSISTTGMRPAGIVSFVNGSSTIENCWSEVAISSSHNDDIDAGGLVARVNESQSLTLSGCLFTGSINYSNSNGYEGGGMIGWTQDNASTTLIDCYFAPSSITVKDKGSHYMFVSGKRDYVSLTNCYYNSVAASSNLDPQGNRARTITGGENVVVAFAGSGDVYDVSGISGYNVGIQYGDVLFAGKSESVQVDLTYTGNIPDHTSPFYTVTNGSLSGITLTLNSSNDATVTINYDHYVTDEWDGTGTEDDPYLIYTSGQWDLLAERVSRETNPISYSGKYFKLMEDISINYNNNDVSYQDPFPKLVGYNESRSFQGTFDGNGHTIVMSYKNKSYQNNAIALFPCVKNATIKRLTVDGYIFRDVCPYGIAGIVGSSYGTTNLISCRSSVDVQNDGDLSPYNANGGGLVAYVEEDGTLNMINCVFDGRLVGHSNLSTYAHLWGGMINYVRDGAKANLINCLFNPEDTKLWDSGATATFARKHDDATVNLTNCYYRNDKLGTTQGTSAIGWPYEQLLDSLGYAWEYIPDLSGYVNVGGMNVWQSRPAVFQPIMQPQTFTGEGTAGSPYQIATAEDWDKLAIYVGHQDSHSSDHFQMTGDISTTTMVGLFNNLAFQGTFDGGGNTLNVNYRVTSMPDEEISTAAPFAFIENATITDLHTAGSITTAGMRPAGVAGFVVGNSSITNCKSEVALTSSHNDDIDAGGFVARVNEDKSVTLTGCLFTGSITYSNPNGYEGGGMVGWTQEGASATLTDCVFAPSAIDITKFVTSNDDKKHRMFVGGKERGNLTNCYYNGVAAMSGMVAEGQRVYDIIPGQNVTVQLYGVATDYMVSGITIYGTGGKGLKFDDVFHAVSGNVLDLGLGVTVPYTVTNYLANGDIITFNDTWNNYTLTMPEEDVTITATFSDVAWDGDGTEESPYLIYYNVQWDLLATNVNAGNNYNGVYFKLMDDISVETMVGSTNRAFRGIFDGGGHTLTFNKGTEASPYDQNFCAPFKAVEAATIKNLHTTGTIYTSAQHAAGFVAQLIPNSGNFTRFISCRSSMKINSTVASDARSGGFIGSCSDGLPSHTQVSNRLSIYFEDCLFDGEFSGTATGWGGFIGYYFWCSSAAGNSGMVHFTRCLFAPSAINISTTDAYTLVRQDAWGWSEMEARWVHFNANPDAIMTINKLYYTIKCGSLQSSPTPVGNMTNVQLRNALGDNWMIVTEEADEKVVPTMGNVVTRVIAGYGENEGGYVLLASPVGTANPAHVAHMLDNAYDLYAFDESEDLEWRNYKANTFDLEPGKGYLYANSEDVTLIFPGAPYTGDGEVTLSKTDNTSADFQGWNLVGNPFNETVYIEDGRSFYTMNADGSELMVSENNTIAPMDGVFVIANNDNETMTFITSEPANNGKAMLALNLSKGHGVIDRAILRFGQGGLLPKFQIKNNSTKVYIQQDNKDYAVVNAEAQGEMPVSFKAKENGSYTLSFSSEEVAFSYLHLIDNMTGNDVDMLAIPSYTFEAQTTDYASRFKLVFSTICEDADGDNEAFAFYSNGSWIISNEGDATLQVIDVNGRILSSETVNGSVSKAINAAPGVYVIRLINGNDMKTQKIVVR